MALYAFDGTGNEDEEHDTNVLEFFRGVVGKDPDYESDIGPLYLPGVGTGTGHRVRRLFEKAFGKGGHDRIGLAFDRLQRNLAAGDGEIDIVGFSRGAALAVSFANELAERQPERRVRFIGVWDIVGQFGLPGRLVNAGHDLDAPPNASHIYHAMALDESRALFPLTRLTNRKSPDVRIIEAWFRGVHSDVGGGNGNDGLNWISLQWMFTNAQRHQIAILPPFIDANLARRVAAPGITGHRADLGVVRSVRPGDFVHESVEFGPGPPGRPHNNPTVATARITDDGQMFL